MTFVVLACAAALAAPDARPSGLSRWYASVRPVPLGESFGDLLVRVARAQVGKPYRDPPEGRGYEEVKVELSSFECTSFLEGSIAVARCLSLSDETEACYLRQVESLRYRGGKRGGFASRLHYLSDWIADNAGRGHFDPITLELGGVRLDWRFDYMSRHRGRYPPLAAPGVFAEIAGVENRLSAEAQVVVPRTAVGTACVELRNGDIVGIATSKSGLLLTHAGIVVKGPDGKARLLHASSFHRRVIVTREDLARYVLRRPERIGLVVARPRTE